MRTYTNEESIRHIFPFLGNLHSLVVELDLNGNILFFNDYACKITGWNNEEVIGKNWFDLFIPPELKGEIGKIFDKLKFDEKKMSSYENPIITKSGKKLCLLWDNVNVYDKTDKVICILSIGVDITERKEAEAALAEHALKDKLLKEKTQRLLDSTQFEKDKLSALINSISDEIWFADAQKKFTLMNLSAQKEFSTNDGFIPKDIEKLAKSLEVLRPDGSVRPVNEAPTLRALRGEIVKNQEEIVRTPATGELRIRQVSSNPVRNASGTIIGAVSIVHDITEQKKIESGLRESEEKYRKLVEQSAEGIMIGQGPIPHIVFANPAVSRILGYSNQELTSLTWKQTMELVHPEDRALFFKRFKDRLEGKSVPEHYVVRVIRKDGAILWMELSSVQLEYGGQPSVQAIWNDITELKKAEEALIASEEKYRELVENANSIIDKLDPNGKILSMNEYGLKFFGYTKEELIGKSIYETIVPKKESTGRNLSNLIGEIFKREDQNANRINENTKKNGEKVWIQWSNRLLRDESGKAIAIFSVGTDITELKMAEEALKMSEVRYKELANSLPEIVFETDLNRKITFVNERAFEIFGYSKEDITKIADILSLTTPQDRGKALEHFTKSMNNKPSSDNAFTLVRKDGSTFPAIVITKPIIEDSRIVGMRGIAIDITERKKVELALKESEEQYRGLVENVNSIILKFDANGKILSLNDYGLKFFGFLQKEILGKSVFDTITPKKESTGRDLSSLINKVLKKSQLSDNINENIKKNGERVWVHWTNRPFKDKNGEMVILSVGMDVTGKRRIEEELETTRQQFADIIEFLPDATMVVNIEGRVIAWNKAMETLTGRTKGEMLHKGNYSYAIPFYETKRPMLLNVILEKNEQLLSKYYNVKKIGNAIEAESIYGNRWLWNKASPLYNRKGELVGAIEAIRDITNQKGMEEELSNYSKMLMRKVEEKTNQLKEVQRLATIGETATMIGHDLRNPLQTILNMMFVLNKRYLKEMPSSPAKDEIASYYELIERNINYMNKIVADLLDYARPMVPEFSVVNLQRLINEILVDIKIPDNIALTSLINRTMEVMVDVYLIKRAFTNVIVNAIQAMPDGGQLTITAEDSSNGTIIKFTDTGKGIPADIIEKLFQPLVTTKAKGMGMGLVIVKRIIDAHKGNINVESEVGKGTTFAITIPLNQSGEKVK